MDYLSEFVIPFKGLKNGVHQYNFQIKDKFFESISYSELKKGDVIVILMLHREENMLTLDFQIDGTIEVNCDRCNELYYQPIKGDKRLIIKFGKNEYEESAEVLVIPFEEHQINVRHYIYEFVNLLLPYRKVHPKDKYGIHQCNPEVIKKLEELKPKPAEDPRWDKLKKLKQNNKFYHK